MKWTNQSKRRERPSEEMKQKLTNQSNQRVEMGRAAEEIKKGWEGQPIINRDRHPLSVRQRQKENDHSLSLTPLFIFSWHDDELSCAGQMGWGFE
mmetsp:Transcript_16021/g.26412  ORF Transcript_16021/g.26412 Transcript_16021/m.26412 type:complete len:95 (-) Transcript_16021:16-300(-)